MIKANIPPEFLLEWFLKSLFSYISKDVSTSRVATEEEAILRDQQLNLIYVHSQIIYEIIPNAPRSNMDFEKTTWNLSLDHMLMTLWVQLNHLLWNP